MTGAPAGVRLFRGAVLLVLGTFFLLPLFAMLEFSTRGGLEGGRDLSAWRAIGDDPQLVDAIITSLQLAVLTSVLMLVLLLPTMVWVHLRVPALQQGVQRHDHSDHEDHAEPEGASEVLLTEDHLTGLQRPVVGDGGPGREVAAALEPAAGGELEHREQGQQEEGAQHEQDAVPEQPGAHRSHLDVRRSSRL